MTILILSIYITYKKPTYSPQFLIKRKNWMSSCLSNKKQTATHSWENVFCNFCIFKIFMSVLQLLRLQSIILVLGNASCTAASWMWIIFHGVMHYYAGFNYRIIDWSFLQNTDLIYFGSKYFQNWLWHNHEISMVPCIVWPEEGPAWQKKFTFSGCTAGANALLYLCL